MQGSLHLFIGHRIEQSYSRALSQEMLGRVQMRLNERLSMVLADARILSELPPIQGLARVAHSAGVDPQDGSSRDVDWRRRLQQIFVSFHEARPDYRQIRFIGMADDGRELVRVDKSGGDIVILREDQLQKRDQAPYFDAVKALTPGDRYISRLNWAHQDGRIVEPRQAVLRYIVPAFDADGELFGMIVINVDANAFLGKVIREVAPPHRVIIRDAYAASFVYDPDTGTGRLYVDRPPPVSAEALRALQDSSQSSGLQRVDGFALEAISSTNEAIEGGRFTTGLIIEADRFTRETRLWAGYLVLFGCLMVLVATSFARATVRRHLAPFLRMTDEIDAARAGRRKPALPATRKDEIGQIARSFDELFEALQELVAQSVKHAEAVFESVQDGVVFVGRHGRITDANAAFARMAGVERDGLTGLPLNDLVPGTFTVDTSGVACQNGSEAGRTLVLDAAHFGGRSVPVEVTLSAISRDPGQHWVCIARDVSSRLADEATRARLIAALESSNSELNSYAFVASHDLKAPLRVIENAATWIEEDLGETLDEETRENLALMRSRIDRMQNLLDDLLEHARIGRKMGESPSPVITGAELRAELCALSTPPDGFTIDFAPGFDAISLPQMPLRSVLLNLLSNAIKHHDRADGRVEISVEEAGEMWRFHVRNDGPGIDPLYHDRIFGLFQTLKSRDQVEGSGMGLAIARKHVMLAGGEMKVVSDGQGRGALFTFTWPRYFDSERHTRVA
ncbi:hypothetical protein AVJ23_04170 [Pseudoponticoccus marisrubri]|uniref:histidine kinase n=1 Tax=Pseudoponticoccus marisrubri TaxID=1685382 RepID=A0A0W7WMG8_9RHOB|nr:hypothetical protein AVJ23_04170 [Pseudoponticoccus marisrubri]